MPKVGLSAFLQCKYHTYRRALQCNFLFYWCTAAPPFSSYPHTQSQTNHNGARTMPWYLRFALWSSFLIYIILYSSTKTNLPSHYPNPHLLQFSIFQSFALNPSNDLCPNLPWCKPCQWQNRTPDEFDPQHLEQNTGPSMGEMLTSSSVTEHLSLRVFSLLRGILICTVH